jgi:predicted phosphodiesterase
MDSATVLDELLTSKGSESLISAVLPNFKEEENIIPVEGTVLVVGDLHGDFEAAKSIVTMWEEMEIDNLVFLGDYVDRGPHQLETINYLLDLKRKHPKKVILLRGNHETPSVNSYYGFLSVCRKEFGEKSDELYNKYNELFSWLSPAALCKRIFMVHGGIPNNVQTLQDINSLKKGDPNDENDILGQLLWNDPSEDYPGFEQNWARGIHYTFGKEAFFNFLEKYNLDMVIRAHEVFSKGYRYFFNDKLLSIFSSPNYRGVDTAVVARIDEGGVILEPVQ